MAAILGLFLALGVHAAAFECDLAGYSEVLANGTDPALRLIASRDGVKPYLHLLFGGYDESAITVVLLGRLLSNGSNGTSAWDHVKETIERLLGSKLEKSKLNDVCNSLKEFRKRILACAQDKNGAKTACLKNLLDYMLAKETYFKANTGLDLALMLGPYTLYSVMTLAVGNMFIKQNKIFQIEGAATLSKIKPAARSFSEYVNNSIIRIVDWRKLAIGHYKMYKYIFFKFQLDSQGVLGVSQKRSALTHLNHLSWSPTVSIVPDSISFYNASLNPSTGMRKRDTFEPVFHKRVKLVVTDDVLGNEIFNKQASGDSFNESMRLLFNEAIPAVNRLREEAGKNLQQVYDEQILAITNQYWRIYDGDGFGSLESEIKYDKWLKDTSSAAHDFCRCLQVYLLSIWIAIFLTT